MGGAQIVGFYEHPGRKLDGYTLRRLYLEILAGVLEPLDLSSADIDSLYTSTTPGGAVGLAENLGLHNVHHFDGTDLGGASYVSHVARASRLVESGNARVALVIMAGLPRQGVSNRTARSMWAEHEERHGSTLAAEYALVAQRHMHEYGTRPEDLAEIKVQMSKHAVHNPHAMLRRATSVDEVLSSPTIASPLRRDDCCVVSDGGGAVLVVSDDVARELGVSGARLLGHAEHAVFPRNGDYQLTHGVAPYTGPKALAEAGMVHADIDYAAIYDSFTITLLMGLEGLGFCRPGEAAGFVKDGGIAAPHGGLPTNSDGGGLANNHPDLRGGMIRLIDALRQLAGQAPPEVQVADCEVALVHGSGYSLGSRGSGSTAILTRGA